MKIEGWPPAVRAGLWILAAVGGVWLLGQLLTLIAFFWDIILLFFLAWLLSFTLRPVVDQLSEHPVPRPVIRWVRDIGHTAWADRLSGWHFSRSVITILVYASLVFLIITILVFIVPVAVTQFGELASRLPVYGAEALAFFQRLQAENPTWLERLNAQAAQFGVDLEEAYRSLNIMGSVQSLAGRLAQNTLGIAAGFASLLANLFLVIILGFYITLDTPRLSHWFISAVPEQWQDEVEFLFNNVDRTFGGFIRSQLLMALISTVGTLVTMQLAGLGFVVVVSLFAGVIMLIPYIGAPIALFLPTLIALFQSGLSTAIVVFLAILALQQLVLHIMMPRIMSETMGMHPLLVFAALLTGVRVAGFWGALFGIPVVGVLAAMLSFIYQRNVLDVSAEISEVALEPDSQPVATTPPMKLEEQRTRSP
ncbi:MAG: AI-2E family transporter [Anaerolineae bacterium]